jgi:hypothetical protein
MLHLLPSPAGVMGFPFLLSAIAKGSWACCTSDATSLLGWLLWSCFQLVTEQEAQGSKSSARMPRDQTWWGTAPVPPGHSSISMDLEPLAPQESTNSGRLSGGKRVGGGLEDILVSVLLHNRHNSLPPHCKPSDLLPSEPQILKTLPESLSVTT